MPPGRAKQTPTPARAPEAPTQAPTKAAASGGNRQATVGNAAMQQRVGEQTPAAEGGVVGAQTTLRDRTHHASVSVSGRLPGNALLGASAGNELKTEASTGFSVGVGRSGMWARFHPALMVRPGGFWERMATGGITLSQLYFDFQTGRASLSIDTGAAGDFLDLFMDLKDGIESKFAAAVTTAMPADLRGGNYDPYTDPTLTQRLSSVVNALATAFPAAKGPDGKGKKGDLLSKITEPELKASVQPKPVTIPLSDGMLLCLDARASLDLVARLDGTLADALAAPRLRELTLATNGLTLEHTSFGLLGGLDLHGITFGPDLSVRDLRYTLGAETGLGLLKVLGMMAQLGTGQDLGIRDTERPELKGIRKKVEDQAKALLPQMLRDQVRQLAGDLPGLPLGQLLSAAPRS